LLFVAFVIGVASAHQLGVLRAVGCCLVGRRGSGFCRGVARRGRRALVPIAAATVIGMPSIRRLRAVDRRAAHSSMLVAATIAVATVARSAVGH